MSIVAVALGDRRATGIHLLGPEEQLWWRSRVRFNLPAVTASFTGRENELRTLDDALEVADRAVITQAINGLGGIDKSQLAARYVQQRADDYDVVAWIRAEDGGIVDLAQLAAKLGVPVEALPPQRARAAGAGLAGRQRAALDARARQRRVPRATRWLAPAVGQRTSACDLARPRGASSGPCSRSMCSTSPPPRRT
jgi:hypothetical protein